MVNPSHQETEQQQFERQIAPQKVALFERQFGENYRLLAYHAALPLVLTPELVHYLRTEFLLALVPSWEAEADLLLSDLCSPVGYELYTMDTAVRAYLLDQMQEDDRIPPDRLQAIAQVLMSYVLYLSRLNPGQREKELQVQRWAAMAYLGDEQCRQMADEIAQQFEASGGQGNSTSVKAEFARLAQITQDLAPQLQAYPELVEFARRVGQVFRSPESLTLEERQETFVVGNRQLQLLEEWRNELDVAQFPPLQILEFTTGQLVEPVRVEGFPPLQLQEVEVVTIVLEAEPNPEELQRFEFEVATLERVNKSRQWVTRKRRQQRVGLWVEPLGNGIELEMVLIPGGTFVMGSPESESERRSAEGPQHEVSLEPFMMGRYPVTQAQWRVVAAMPQINRRLEPKPSHFKGDKLPVERVSWYDAVEFCDRLSQLTGRSYRLPSEAEWEYACRANPVFMADFSKIGDAVGDGIYTPFHFGETITTELANYNGNYAYGSGPKGTDRKQTTPVGSFGVANAFGLCDMHGNVWEWCLDHWHGSYKGAPTDGSAWVTDNESSERIRRGGSWDVDPRYCRSASRLYNPPVYRYNDIGFRVVCSAPGTL